MHPDQQTEAVSEAKPRRPLSVLRHVVQRFFSRLSPDQQCEADMEKRSLQVGTWIKENVLPCTRGFMEVIPGLLRKFSGR